MAHSRTAKKNIRKNAKRRIANRTELAAMRTSLKAMRTSIAEKDVAKSATSLSVAQQRLDKAARRHLIHRNKAARVKSRLAKAANAVAGAKK